MEISAEMRNHPGVQRAYSNGYRIEPEEPVIHNGCWVTDLTGFRGKLPVGTLPAEWDRQGGTCLLGAIGVDDEHQGKGVGTALVICAVILSGCQKLQLSSQLTPDGEKLIDRVAPILSDLGVEILPFPKQRE